MPNRKPPTPAHSLLLRLLQSPAVIRPSTGEVHRLSARDAALLAYLALHGETPRARLAALLWADKPAATGLNNLRQRAHRLYEWAGERVLVGDSTLALNASVSHDLVDPATALRQDAAAPSGPLLGTLDYDSDVELAAWVASERDRWRARVAQALLQLGTEREAEGRIDEALSHAARLVVEEPLLEQGARLLMQLHHRRGNRVAALEAYERCVRALHQEIGEPPSDATVALAKAISANDVPAVRALTPVPLALRHPPRTVGRDEALAAAARRWHDGGVVILSGPAGIGKTRVFNHLLLQWGVRSVCRLVPDDATGDLALLRRLAVQLLQCLPDGDDQAFGVLRKLTDPLDATLAETQQSDRMATLLGKALAAAKQSGVAAIAIDDLQFADPESAAVLCRLVQSGAGPRWLLTCRDGQLPQPFQQWLLQLGSGLHPEIALQPLDGLQLVQFLETVLPAGMDTPRWAGALHAHCGGHPHSLLQVLRELHDRGELEAPAPPARLPMPRDAMRQLVRKLDASDPVAQQLAFIAALAGADFDAPLACKLLHRSVTELAVHWRQLEEAGVLHGNDFSHLLVRQAVLDAVPAALTPAIRRDIAAALAEAGRSAGRRALHWEAAGEWLLAGDDFERAAGESLHTVLQTKARDLLLHAGDWFQRAGSTHSAFAVRYRASELTLACESAAAALQQLSRLLADAEDDRQRCLTLCLRAKIHFEQHDAAALADARESLALARHLGDEALVLQARLREAAALQLTGSWPQALGILQALQSEADGMDRAQRHQVADALTDALAAVGRLSDAVTAGLAACEDALADNDYARVAERTGNVAVQLAYLCRTEEAIEALRRAVAYAQRAGVEKGYRLVDEMTLAGCLQDAGKFSEAMLIYERVVPELKDAGYLGWSMNAATSLAGLFIQLGRLDLAQRQLPDAPSDAPIWARALRRAAQARWAHASGRPSLRTMEEAVAMLHQGGALRNAHMRYLLDVAVAKISEPDRAVALAATVKQWAADHEHVGLARMAGSLEIDALTRGGQLTAAAERADQLFEAIAGDWQACNFYLADLWWALVNAWDAVGRCARADPMAAHAVRWMAERAEQDVPAVFKESFLTRNPANRNLLERQRTKR